MERTGVALVLLFATACDGALFAPKDRELAPCYPNCNVDTRDGGVDAPDSGVPDSGGRDAGHRDAGFDHDAGTRDGGVRDAGDHRVLIDLLGMHATPNSITWMWRPLEIEPETFTGYELRYGTEASVVEVGGGAVWDAEDDGNLAFRTSPAVGLVRQTTVTGLEPSTLYHARLYAHFVGTGPEAVAAGSEDTYEVPIAEIVLFTEALGGRPIEGFQNPELAARTHEGMNALWFEGTVTEATLGNLELTLPDLQMNRWNQAYLELFVDVAFDGAIQPINRIDLGLSGPMDRNFVHSYVVLPRRQGWHRIQVPLIAFENAGSDPLTFGSSGGSLTRFSIAAEFPGTSVVFVDDVRIRY